MFKLLPGSEDTGSDPQAVFESVAWPVLMVNQEGLIIAASPSVEQILCATPAELLYQPLQGYLRLRSGAGLFSTINDVRQLGSRLTLPALVITTYAPVLSVELELIPDTDLTSSRVTILLYQHSRARRREALILELNRLIPRLMACASEDEALTQMNIALWQMGLSAMLFEFDPATDRLRLRRQLLPPQFDRLLSGQFDFPRRSFGVSVSLVDRLFATRRGMFHATMRSFFDTIFKPEELEAIASLQQLVGIQGYIAAPMMHGGAIRGVLILSGPLLGEDETPFVEVFVGQIAAVLDQIELRRRIEYRMQQMNSLAATARAVTTLGRLDEVLRTICDQARILLRADTAMIGMPTGDARGLECVMITGSWADVFLDTITPIEGSMVGRAYLSGMGEVVHDAWTDPNTYYPQLGRSKIRAAMLQPMQHQGQMMGVLMLASEEVGRFTDADLEYAARYAEYAAVAIANAQAHAARERSEADLRKHRQELETLLRVGQSLSQSLDLHTILEEMLRVLEEDLSLADFAGILLSKEGTNELSVALTRNIPPRLAEDPEIVTIGPWTEMAFEAGQPVCVNVTDEMRPTLRRIFGELHVHSAAIAPLIAEGRLLGTITVGRSMFGYSEQELQVLHVITGQLAQAIANAQIHQKLRLKAEQYEQLFEEAEAMRQYLTTVMQHAPDTFLILRRDGSVQPLSENMTARFGYDSDEIAGRHFLDFIPTDLHTAVLAQWDALQRGKTVQFETEILSRSGSRIAVLLSAGWIEQYNEVLAVLKDVSQQRELEARVRQSEKLAALGRMVAGTAHELNNPLAVILGLAQLHLLDALPGQLRSDMIEIEQAAQRASTIVQQLRTFARPPSIRLLPIDLPKILHAVLARLAPALKATGVELQFDIPEQLPQIAGNDHQIDQVLWNILQNAVQALAGNPPERPGRILVTVRLLAPMIEIVIADNGPGIASEDLPRIFEPFFTTQGVGQGIGLGLAIVHAIIQQHNGEIWAESHPNEGAKFYLRLPTVRVSEAPIPAPEPLPRQEIAQARVLIVEDEPVVRAVVVRMLAHNNWQIDTVASGVEALEAAIRVRYDLIISDLQMPEIDGPMLYDRLASNYPPERWLILTGDTMNERSRTFLERTRLTVLAKPFTREQLIGSVMRCLFAAASLHGEFQKT